MIEWMSFTMNEQERQHPNGGFPDATSRHPGDRAPQKGEKVISIIDNHLQLETLALEIDRNLQAAHLYFLHPGRPVFTRRLLEDFGRVQQILASLSLQELRAPRAQRLRYLILASKLDDVFCLGGDLALFIDLIERRDAETLSAYAHACTDLLQCNLAGRDGGLTTISLVQGQALGGGFETALAADVIIAERKARFGFPEIQFGLFPGMGAFSFLARRITPALAKRMIIGGRIHTAEELYEMGVVDYLAEDGHGQELLRHYLLKRREREGGYGAMDRIVAQHEAIPFREINQIVDLWVETAMALGEKNLAMMRFLLKAQRERWGGADLETASINSVSA